MVKDYFLRNLDESENASQETVAKGWGVSRKTLNLYINSFHGQEIKNEIYKEVTQDIYPDYLSVLKARALSGSIKHMELLAKLLDWFPAAKSKQEITTRIIDDEDNVQKNGYTTEQIKELEALLDEDMQEKRIQ